MKTELKPRTLKSLADARSAAQLCGAPSDWLLWQLADSAFPTGGFAHSGGLEAAWQQGEIQNRAELQSFLEANLQQLSRTMIPFINAAFAEPARFSQQDQLCEAFLSNHVANRASRLQGRAFLTAAERIFQVMLTDGPEGIRFAHLAPVFGACLFRLKVGHATALRLFVFNHLRGMLAAAVRLNLAGPMEAQILQKRLAPLAEMVAAQSGGFTLDDLAQSAPLQDLWQGAQDRLYSRLFQT